MSPSRDELLTLMREWGWRMESEWPGRYQVWEHGRAQAIVPSDPELADYDDLMRQAWAVLGTAEGPRLLGIVREVAALHHRTDASDDPAWRDVTGILGAYCAHCLADWPCKTARAVAMTETTKGETDAS